MQRKCCQFLLKFSLDFDETWTNRRISKGSAISSFGPSRSDAALNLKMAKNERHEATHFERNLRLNALL